MPASDHPFYLTIASLAEGFYKEKGSKFLAFAWPVKTEDEIKQHLEALRKQYYDARHHCYAYILGNKSEKFRANDDGEPNHSAGNPILGQIRSKELTNTLVVVVRYFGGTKLGVGGLINAYKTAAGEALEKAEIIEVPITETVTLYFPYDKTNEVMRLVKEYEINIRNQEFLESCELTGDLPPAFVQPLKAQIDLIEAVRMKINPAE